MSPRAETTASLETEARQIVAELRRCVSAGETHWFLALMQAIRDWPLPEESINGRTYRYLVGGEAFDWLLLAERLCDEIESLIPDGDREALLFHGNLPEEVDEHDVERLLGAKHRAYLNFVYGVRVEEALQLAIADEVHKERFACRIWENGRGDDEVFQRLYDSSRADLLEEFRESKASTKGASKKTHRSHIESDLTGQAENGHANSHSSEPGIALAELTEFTYWLFRHRINGSEPARVASDTRKGLAMLQRLEALRRARTSTVT